MSPFLRNIGQVSKAESISLSTRSGRRKFGGKFFRNIGVLRAASSSYNYTTSWGLDTNSSDNALYTFRQVLKAAVFTQSGSSVIVTFQAGSTNLVIDGAYIGAQGAGDAYDFAATPVQLLFGGSGSVEITAGATQASDTASISITASGVYVVSMYFSTLTKGSMKQTNDDLQANTANYYKLASDAATVDATGYTGPDADQYAVKSIQVFGP